MCDIFLWILFKRNERKKYRKFFGILAEMVLQSEIDIYRLKAFLRKTKCTLKISSHFQLSSLHTHIAKFK